jgi:L,D-peptidoglycan transpeptidase YkuD (ErfK/YbiS/YcfS/YnhG family)
MYRSMAFFGAMLGLVLGGAAPARAAAGELARDATQLVVCIAPEQTASEGTLQLYHRDATGAWQPDSGRWPVMFARGGLAWGRGLNPPQPGPRKKTDDHRNPAGLFLLGPVLGYAPTLPEGSQGWPYHQVTDRDAWIDDPHLPGYNHLYTLPPGAPFPDWWGREHLKLGDFAYEWLVVIEHNYNPPQEDDGGNAIFFHVRRGEHYRTAGCTTMERDRLMRLVKWLKPGSHAMMVELTQADYARLWKPWGLPPPR